MIHSRARWALLCVVAISVGASCSSTPPAVGGLRQACFANATCNAGLACLSNVCVALPDGGAGTSGTAGGAGTAGASGASGASGVGGTAGATAGTAGGDAAAGTTGGDAAAGTAGVDAAAGTAGGDAAAGTGGQGAAAGAAGADAGTDVVVNCGLAANRGAITLTAAQQSASESTPALGVETVQEVDWLAELDTTQKTDILAIELISMFDPFGATITTQADLDLATQSQIALCGACVVVVLKADSQNPLDLPLLQLGPTYVATSGKLNLTRVPTFPAGAASRVSGTISDVVFEHVTIDPQTNTTEPAGDGCKFTITSVAFDAPVP
jgi:hypothetical protein